jgi:hypothetical protein
VFYSVVSHMDNLMRHLGGLPARWYFDQTSKPATKQASKQALPKTCCCHRASNGVLVRGRCVTSRCATSSSSCWTPPSLPSPSTEEGDRSSPPHDECATPPSSWQHPD